MTRLDKRSVCFCSCDPRFFTVEIGSGSQNDLAMEHLIDKALTKAILKHNCTRFLFSSVGPFERACSKILFQTVIKKIQVQSAINDLGLDFLFLNHPGSGDLLDNAVASGLFQYLPDIGRPLVGLDFYLTEEPDRALIELSEVLIGFFPAWDYNDVDDLLGLAYDADVKVLNIGYSFRERAGESDKRIAI